MLGRRQDRRTHGAWAVRMERVPGSATGFEAGGAETEQKGISSRHLQRWGVQGDCRTVWGPGKGGEAASKALPLLLAAQGELRTSERGDHAEG